MKYPVWRKPTDKPVRIACDSCEFATSMLAIIEGTGEVRACFGCIADLRNAGETVRLVYFTAQVAA